MSPNTRVLLLHNIMTPYRYPLFRALAQEPGIDLTVWFMSRTARNRRWTNEGDKDLGFNYQILPSVEFNHASSDLFTYIFNYTFPWNYLTRKPDLLISAGCL